MSQWTTAPAIVAEALVGVSDPLLTALSPGEPCTAEQVARNLARSLAPPEQSVEPPAWLLAEQAPSFRRTLAALERYRGALLADPVGSGKTYIALAVAAARNRGVTACLVPAPLVPQWRATAARLGIPVSLGSHEQVSRGKLPRGTRGLVIVDESHHYRNPHTRRYRHLASWLVGRPAMLVTATPIINRLEDLGHQLLLTIRDNALVTDGILSIRAMLAGGLAAPALGQIVIESELGTRGRPDRIQRRSTASALECFRVGRLVQHLNVLRLSRCPAIRRLIHGILLRSLGSSPAALAGALRQYRRLLQHARDACQAGQRLDRARLRQFARQMGDQLIWWELLPAGDTGADIELDDLGPLDNLIAEAAAATLEADGKLDRLKEILRDGRPTLVFTTSRGTVAYLRRRLGGPRVAWCTGEKAGIGTCRVPRSTVWAWFRDAITSALAPQHLIVTDVAAEGLDLRRAQRIVHYDLPWTPMRLEQREGRSARCGSDYSTVEVVRFEPPPLLERLLRTEAILARKGKLPALVGLGQAGRQLWRWRAELARRFGGRDGSGGAASTIFPVDGLLLGFQLSGRGNQHPFSATVLWLERDGSWSEAPELIEARISAAAGAKDKCPIDPQRLREWLALATRPVRERLSFIRGRRWITAQPTAAARRLLERLQFQVREAARRHQPSRLARLERALLFVADGHTAGEEILIERLAEARECEVLSSVEKVQGPQLEWDGIEASLTGVIIFGPAEPAFSRLASSECQTCKPRSSISTAP